MNLGKKIRLSRIFNSKSGKTIIVPMDHHGTSIKGKSISVTKLKIGDKVLINVEKEARHFGVKICKTISEK